MKEIELFADNLEEEIRKLPYATSMSDTGDGVYIPESDYGFAEIYRMYDDILVFLIPTYGGTPQLTYHVGRHAIDSLVKKLRAIT